MAHFRASIIGQSGREASRLGSKKSGISAFVNGWQSGVNIQARHSDDQGDIFDIFLTSGSSPEGKKTFLGSIRQNALNEIVFVPTGEGAIQRLK